MNVIDLFAGTGAFSHTFPDNFKVVFANDIEKNSKEIYSINHPNKFTLEDLHNVSTQDIPPHDVLCAGFPCQGFSIAGLRKGFEDKRSNVFWKIMEIIEHHQPQILLLENVKNLKSHDKGRTFEIIKENIEKHGYHMKHAILDTCKITVVPQHRERIYMICFKDKELHDKFEFDFPTVQTNPITTHLENDIPDKYYYTDRFKVYNEIEENVVKHVNENVLYQYRRYYVRENKGGVCPTLTANMGGGGHNVPLLLDDKGIRKLTPRECFNLQGFPQDYKLPTKLSDSALYKLAGNAVSVPVVKLIVDKLVKLI